MNTSSTLEVKHQACFPRVFHKIADTLTLVFTEVFSMVYSAVLGLKKRKVHCYNMNPTKLTPEELQRPAVLYLHGLWHDQTGGVKIAKALQKHKTGCPFFGVNLKYDNNDPNKYLEPLKEKITEIRDLYKAHGHEGPVRVILICHSWGTRAGIEYLEEQVPGTVVVDDFTLAGRVVADDSCHQSIKPAIEKVESIILEHPEVKFHHFVAYKDYLLSENAGHRKNKKFYVIKNRSHLAVIYAKQTHEKIVELIKRRYP